MIEHIEKRVAIDAMKQLPHEYGTKEQRARTGGIAACQMVVRSLPPADVRPVVHGHWIDYDDDYGAYSCSVCGENAPEDTEWPFCPYCGADMREDKT